MQSVVYTINQGHSTNRLPMSLTRTQIRRVAVLTTIMVLNDAAITTITLKIRGVVERQSEIGMTGTVWCTSCRRTKER